MELRESRYAAGLRQEFHAHDFATVTFVAGGELVERVAGSERRGSAGDVIVKPRGLVHEDVYGREVRVFTLIGGDEVHSYGWTFGGPAAALFSRAIDEWRHGARYDDVAIDLLAVVDSTAPSKVSPGRMRDVAERVICSDVTVGHLAGELSMHPVALARAFRRTHGCSITPIRHPARVRRAAELLVAGASLVDVALESGFADQSHFCRIFKTEMGLTPSAFRAMTV
jgi:AraC family transcriptional regulator